MSAPRIQGSTPLASALASFLSDPAVTPFSTPGHKRSPALADALLALDAPLSSGADDLHQSRDVIGQAEGLAAALWGASYCRFCLNGSTQGNHALVLAVARPGDKVVVARSLHKSLLAGLVLAGLEPVWVRPDVDPATGLALAVPVERVVAALPDARAVFLVEPNFVGVLSDVAGMAEAAHDRGVPLVVDQAWGAHLGFHPALPPSALSLGADAIVVSAHKTLTSFTQGAVLLAQGTLLDLARLDEAFELTHTTSPSAAILGSLDRARALMAERGPELLGRTIELVAAARERLSLVEGLRVLDSSLSGITAYDPTKLVLALAGTGADGLEVEADLRAAGITLELANRDTLVPLASIADTAESVEHLVESLERSLARQRGDPRPPGGASVVWGVDPEVALSPREAFFARRETVAARTAGGRISAEMIAPYPPGIPALAPGEVIRPELLEALREAAAAGTRIAYCADPTLATVQVVAR
jgi:lysine decarboxylase